jgi:hypothetical protein
MSIGSWFKQLFSSSGRTGVAAETDREMIDIDQARLNAGGGGVTGMATHESPGDDAARYESENY